MGWSPYVIDTFIAAKLSQFTHADIPDMSVSHPESRHWMFNYVGNSALTARLDDMQQYRHWFMLLRRAMTAFDEYNLARMYTLRYVEQERERDLAAYLNGVQHWEYFLSASTQSFLLMIAMARFDKELVYRAKDSVENRARLLRNASIHAEGEVERGKIPSGALAVWLCNEGLECADALLTFSEAAQFLGELGDLADVLQDPLTSAEGLRSLRDRWSES